LEDAVEKRTFRGDLFYRLNVVPLRLPNLKERPEDILLLAHNFLLEESRKLRRGQTSFSPAAIAALSAHDWPGNVRELQNRIRRALGTTMNRVITPVDLGLEEIPMEPEEQKLTTLKADRKAAEKNAVRRALASSGNNISQAARLLEISRPTLHDLLKKHRIIIDKQ
jgi:two-component system NtrC family response regulator